MIEYFERTLPCNLIILSTEEPPKILQNVFNDNFEVAFFYDKLKCMECEDNNVMEILSIIDAVPESLSSRWSSNFFPFAVKKNAMNSEKKIKMQSAINSSIPYFPFIEKLINIFKSGVNRCIICKHLNGWITNRKENWNMNGWKKLFLQSKKIKISANLLFDQAVDLKRILKSKQNDEEFKKKTCSCKIYDFFAANCITASYSEILEIAQYFFCYFRV